MDVISDGTCRELRGDNRSSVFVRFLDRVFCLEFKNEQEETSSVGFVVRNVGFVCAFRLHWIASAVDEFEF